MLQKFSLVILLTTLFLSCRESHNVSRIEGKRLEIDNSLSEDSDIEAFIAPYRAHVNKDMDNIISYSAKTLSKVDGEFNTAIGNLMADAVFEESNPILQKRLNKSIDFVLLNHGGIRSIISKGNITTRTAYEVMPFENAVIVVAMTGKQLQDMFKYLQKAKRAHPISRQLQIILGPNYELNSVLLKGKAIDMDTLYYVATNDYLFNGGDGMTFFQSNKGVYPLDYKIRNVLVDHFKKHDTLRPQKDNRFIKI